VAVLLNEGSNLCLRLEPRTREHDGTRGPASIRCTLAVEANRHRPDGEHAFERLLGTDSALVLDLDVICLVESLEALLSGASAQADFASAVAPGFGVRVERREGADASEPACPYVVEAGVDLAHVLEGIGGAPVQPGTDLALFRFPATARALAAFASRLAAEYGRFPTETRTNPAGSRA